MGREKKIKKVKALTADHNHWSAFRTERAKEKKLVKPGHFFVYQTANWISG